MKILQFVSRRRSSDVISQEELAALEQKLAIKVIADAGYMTANAAILERIRSGATVEPGRRSYCQHRGVSDQARAS